MSEDDYDDEEEIILSELDDDELVEQMHDDLYLSLIHISEPTRLRRISYAVFCLKKKKN